jgi:hypothetical protein
MQTVKYKVEFINADEVIVNDHKFFIDEDHYAQVIDKDGNVIDMNRLAIDYDVDIDYDDLELINAINPDVEYVDVIAICVG